MLLRYFEKVRGRGARDFCITGDFNVELGLMCIDEKDNEDNRSAICEIQQRSGDQQRRC